MRRDKKPKKEKSDFKKEEPKYITLSERKELHEQRHPNDKNKASGSISGGVNWINLNKKANQHLKARHEQLEEFYETHEWVGQYPNAKWVKVNLPQDVEEQLIHDEGYPEVQETEEE